MIEALAEAALAAHARGSLRPVINATGVVIHTNLGRAPIADAAIERVAAIAKGYSNLEYDLAEGERGSRTVHAESLLTSLTGAEAAIVVNNNAAATLLILTGLAAGREVVISRGELVEIGGGFRVPDVMRAVGRGAARGRHHQPHARHRLHGGGLAGDGDVPARAPVELPHRRIHRAPVARAIWSAAARAMQVPVVEDIGSGCLVDDLAGEPSVQASIAAGVDLVCFSGDKLLGGPQAGIIAGRKALVDRLRTHPLMRALRVDKITLRDPRSDAGRVRRRPRRHHRAGAADAARCRRKRSKRARRRWPQRSRRRVAGGDDQRVVGGRRRQRAGRAAADGVAVDRAGRSNPPPPPSNGCARSIRRSSRASSTIASSSISAPCCPSRTARWRPCSARARRTRGPTCPPRAALHSRTRTPACECDGAP